MAQTQVQSRPQRVPARSTKDQLAWEIGRRQRLAVPAMAGGVLYLLSGIVTSTALRNAPTVGPLQGLRPALEGIANPAVSPRAAEVKYLSHHAFALIAGSVMNAIGFIALALAMTFVYDATRHRRPETVAAARPLLFYGGIGAGLLTVAHYVAFAITTHQFATGHDFTNKAVDRASGTAPGLAVIVYLQIILTLMFGIGIAMTAYNAQRVGLLTRMMGFAGVISGVVLVLALGGASLTFVVALWVVALGFLLMGRWPGGDPPAWATGEARPWPSAAEVRAQREAANPGRGARPAAAAATAGAGEAPPEPVAPAGGARSRKRKRKRGPNQRNR